MVTLETKNYRIYTRTQSAIKLVSVPARYKYFSNNLFEYKITFDSLFKNNFNLTFQKPNINVSKKEQKI